MVLTSSTLVTVTSLDNSEEAWVYKDFTAGYFSGDFEFHTQVNNAAATGTFPASGLWAVANTVGTLSGINAVNGDYISVSWRKLGGNNFIILEESNNGSITNDTSTIVSGTTEYYLKIVRDETVGTYGTVFCYIYTGSIGGTLIDTLVVTLTEKQNFRYLYWMVARNDALSPNAWSGTIQNLVVVTPTP